MTIYEVFAAAGALAALMLGLEWISHWTRRNGRDRALNIKPPKRTGDR